VLHLSHVYSCTSALPFIEIIANISQPCQSLFVAPCSHVWHYKCIRPILNGHTWPNFLCPNCRAVADLEADVEEQEDEWEEDSLEAAIEASKLDDASHTQAGAAANDQDVLDDEEEPDGVRTPRAMEPIPSPRQGAEIEAVAGPSIGEEYNGCPSADDDDLTTISHLDLHSPEIPESEALERSETPPELANNASVSALAAPRPIPGRAGSSYELHLGTTGVEGPMTPRNDAGPFVLDGGAGRSSTGSTTRRPVGSLDAAAAEAGSKA
jgi:hypothetical protein